MNNQSLGLRPTLSSMGADGLPGVLVAAHRRAKQFAPPEARSYTVFTAFVDANGKSVAGPTPTVRTLVRYYETVEAGKTKLPARSSSSLIVATALMTLVLLLVSPLTLNAQTRSDPVGALERTTWQLDRVAYSVACLRRRAEQAKRATRGKQQHRQPVTTNTPRCQPGGNGNTRPRRVCR